MATTMIKCAKSDLFVVSTGLSALTSSDEELLGTSFYFMYQAVEKSLKAVLERVGLDARTCGNHIPSLYHSVMEHVPTVLSQESVAFLDSFAEELSSYRVSGRYPSEVRFSYQLAKEMYPKVQQVYVDCDEYLKLNS